MGMKPHPFDSQRSCCIFDANAPIHDVELRMPKVPRDVIVTEKVKLKLDPQFHPTARVLCPNNACPSSLMIFDLTSEDGAIMQYDGACSTCGCQYHLILNKEKL